MTTFTEELQQAQRDWKIMNNPFLDDRPLTEETLKELGFEDLCGGNPHLYDILKVKNHTLYSWILPEYLWKTECANFIAIHGDNFKKGDAVWKTVGSVKMLIEALKGDE